MLSRVVVSIYRWVFKEIGKIPTVKATNPHTIPPSFSAQQLSRIHRARQNHGSTQFFQTRRTSGLSNSLSLCLISFPCSVWLLRKYATIEEQGFKNFSDQPNSRQPNRVLAFEYYRKHGFFFSSVIIWF